MTLHESHGTMLRYRKRNVFEHSPNKVASHYRALTEGATLHDRAAKVGEAAVGDNNEVGEKRFLLFLAFSARAHPNHAVRERAFDQICHRCFDNLDAGGSLGVCAEVLHEAAMVERTALSAGGVWYMHGFAGVEDCVAVHRDSIDVIKT